MKWKNRAIGLALAGCMAVSVLPAVSFAADMGTVTQSELNYANSGTCGENLTWTLDGSVLTISGSGEMKDFSSTSDNQRAPWYDSKDSITNIVIKSGVTSIGKYAFYMCGNVVRVEIADSVTCIGKGAFDSCTALTQIQIPSSVTCIGNAAFYSCTALTQIQIPSNVTDIGESAFIHCESLESIVIPDGIVEINSYTFAYCFNLRSVTIPGSVVTLADSAFQQCTSLKEITLPDSVTKIGHNVFSDCTSLKKIEIPDSVVTMGCGAFYGCSNLNEVKISSHLSRFVDATGATHGTFEDCDSLKSIIIPNSVSNIGARTFLDCDRLASIEIPDSVTTVGDYAFQYCRKLNRIYFFGDAPTIKSGTFSSVTATAYYPRNASGWEDVIQDQYGGTITWEPWTPGEIPAENNFSVNKDAWGFENSPTAFGNVSEGYYITRNDYNRLTTQLSNVDKEKISFEKTQRKILFSNRYTTKIQSGYNINGNTANHIEWNGSCYGMSVWSCLTKNGTRNIADLNSSAANLHSVAFNAQVESAINYYHRQTSLSSIESVAEQFTKLAQVEQLTRLEEMASKVPDSQTPVLIWFVGYGVNADGSCNTSDIVAHAVVGYKAETGFWEKSANGVTDTYTKRILIYDCADLNQQSDRNLYYDEDGAWCIPGWNIRSTSSQTADSKYNNGKLCLVTNDVSILNAVDYKSGNASLDTLAGSNAQLTAPSDASYSLKWNGGSVDVSGISVSNSTGNAQVCAVATPNVTTDGQTTETDVTVCLPSAESYTVTSKEENSIFQLDTGNYLASAATKMGSTITFQADGSAAVKASKPTEYLISLTANKGYYTLPWSTVEVSGEDAAAISAEMTEKGIVVDGDNLTSMTITGSDNENTEKVTISSDANSVLISENNDRIAIWEDKDQDGVYETDITPSTTPVNEVFSDVPANAWYTAHVQYVYDNNLMSGTSTTTFEPNSPLTRAMVVQILYNKEGKPEVTGTAAFSDVKPSDWYYNAVQWAKQNGVAAGSGGKFNPMQNVTREQFAQFLYNYEKTPAVSGSLDYPDANQVSSWAKNAMLWANQNGIVNGKKQSNGTLLLDPKGLATRAEAAAMLKNYLTKK